jgi:hypothetical protein
MNYNDPFVNIWVNQGVHSEALYHARPKSNSTYPYIDVFVIMLENPFNESTVKFFKWGRKKKATHNYWITAVTNVGDQIFSETFRAYDQHASYILRLQLHEMSQGIYADIDRVVHHVRCHVNEHNRRKEEK